MRRGPLLVSVLLLAVGATVAVVATRTSSESTAARTAPTATATTTPAPSPPVKPAPAADTDRLRDEGSITLDRTPWRSLDDAARDGWTTEVAQQQVGALLGAFVDVIEGKGGGTEGKGAFAFVDASAPIAGMLPTEGPEQREAPASKPGLRVRVGLPSAAGRGSGAALAAADALRGALREAAGSAGHPHAKWKIEGIQVDGDTLQTRQRLFAAVASAQGGADLSGVFSARWRRTGQTLVLLELSAAELTWSQRRGGPWLRDVTAGWLASTTLLDAIALDGDDLLHRVEALVPNDPIGHRGLAVADVDGDGIDDLYVGMGSGLPNQLLLGTGRGFREAGASANVDYLEETRGVLLLDLDGDGFRDLAAATAAGVVLARNLGVEGGVPRFGPPAFPLGEKVGHSLAAADIDGDGDLDLYVGAFYGEGQRGHAGFPIPVPYHDANNGGRNVLLRNEGGMRFVDATAAVGLDQHNRRFTQAAAFFDVDDDGDPDLYVANDHGRNAFYRNDGGRFREVAGEVGAEDLGAGMSVSFGDADGDGDPDLYVSNMYSSAGNRVVPQARFAARDAQDRAQRLRHARGNTLLLQGEGGAWQDASVDSGAMVAGWAWGSRLLDLDSDGKQDLVVANGLYTRHDPGDL